MELKLPPENCTRTPIMVGARNPAILVSKIDDSHGYAHDLLGDHRYRYRRDCYVGGHEEEPGQSVISDGGAD